MNKPEIDTIHKALDLASQALFVSSPNPRVGCILVSPKGKILGEGFTQRAGGAHAEIMALNNALERGNDVKDAVAYVTLEPCSHYGRTAPCCDALIRAKISKVISCIADPNPLVSGQGFSRLRAAGIEVVVGPGYQQARELNIGFFSRMIRGVPWVRMKAAASLDGVTALHNEKSKWITSSDARADGHLWRARACAILTGIGTVIHDNPKLDVRYVKTPRQPFVVVVDSELRTPLNANLFSDSRRIFIYTAVDEDEKRTALENKGATVIQMPNSDGQVDLLGMLRDLAQRGINELHVEAGHQLNGALIRDGLVDELLVYLAPRFLGAGRGIVDLNEIHEIEDGPSLEFKSINSIGPDLRVVARLQGKDNF